jgi:hypothetical protein
VKDSQDRTVDLKTLPPEVLQVFKEMSDEGKKHYGKVA